MERADEIESKTPPSGIGGLLVFFIFGLFGNAAFNAFKAVKILLSSPSPIAYIDVLLDLALAGLAFFAAVQLVRVKNQGIRLSKVFIWLNGGVSILIAVGSFAQAPGTSDASMALTTLGRTLLFSMLWLMYLERSVRVRNTYGIVGKPKELSTEPPSPETGQPIAIEPASQVASKITRHPAKTLKYILASVAICALVVVLGIAHRVMAGSPVEKQTTSPPTIFFDDIAYAQDGNDFSTAFALESKCAGLSLMTWTNHTSEERMLGLKSEWSLSYATSPESGRGGGALYHRHAGADLGNFDFQVGFSSDRPEDAAQKVCLIVTSRGGTIR